MTGFSLIAIRQTALTDAGLFQWLYIPLAIWLVLVVLLMVLLLRKYTFGQWSPEHPNPYRKETMGLPRGVMRGILTLTLLVVVVLLQVLAIRFEDLQTRMGDFMVAFQMMLSFYFGSKVVHHLGSVDERKNREAAKAAENIEKAKTPEPSKNTHDETEEQEGQDFDEPKAVG